MKARLRIIIAASFALLTAAAPALAQDAGSTPQNNVVGPPQLKDFTLNGTVTRPAPSPTSEQPRQAPPAQTQPAPSPRTQTQATPQRPNPEPRNVTPRQAQPQPQPQQQQPQATASDVTTLPPPPPPPPESTGEAGEAAVPVASDSPAQSPGGFPTMTWIVAALAVLGAAGWFFLRQRQRESYAGAGHADRFEVPPAPETRPPVPAAAPTPAPAPKPEPQHSGIVSSRLRPWLEIEFNPTRGVIDHEKASISFDLFVYNSGSVPARDVHVLAALINGGPMQEQQIRLFFDNPSAGVDGVPVVPPLQRITLSTSVALPRDQVRPIEVEGRQLFVPMIAFNALYAWSGGTGQTSTSFLVGKQTNGEKLAPLRVDLGARIFRNLAAREHDLRVRK